MVCAFFVRNQKDALNSEDVKVTGAQYFFVKKLRRKNNRSKAILIIICFGNPQVPMMIPMVPIFQLKLYLPVLKANVLCNDNNLYTRQSGKNCKAQFMLQMLWSARRQMKHKHQKYNQIEKKFLKNKKFDNSLLQSSEILRFEANNPLLSTSTYPTIFLQHFPSTCWWNPVVF